ncbi:hypothetical protein [uncultured Aquimarina sp.]|uniref:hypothetical protein n=1 Tax=uncultured Aquimarina sp. TaxID=575652 RepID=UPI00260EEAD7|nr:hypothetical protein [uncultured Aquimarina sp.]
MVSEKLTTKKEDLTNYTGTYVLANRAIEVQLKRGKLILTEKGKWSSKLTSIGSSKFIVDIVKPKATIEFVTNAKGSISKCILTQGEQPNGSRKIKTTSRL